MPLSIGCIADDITGASDIALMLANHGLPVTQILGQPQAGDYVTDGAVVIALKIRSVSADEAVGQALASAQWLVEQGTQQYFYKYCSTFDSTPDGNIGPISLALLELLNEPFTVVCPAFPGNNRTIKHGNLYVGDQLLENSPMRNHPLNPMTDSSLLRLMDAQTYVGATALLPIEVIEKGEQAIKAGLNQLRGQGSRFAVLDAASDEDLLVIGKSCSTLRLLTGASGLAMGLPANFGYQPDDGINGCAELPKLPGSVVVLAGSCSLATRGQVQYMQETCGSIEIDPVKLHAGTSSIATISELAVEQWRRGHVLIHSRTDGDAVRQAQSELGAMVAADLVESALAGIALKLQQAGACKFIIAGGETSGSVANSLNARVLKTGPQIDIGVPWMIHAGSPPMVLAFKSGNFGQADFFIKAMEMLK